jgi:hypothetical protein
MDAPIEVERRKLRKERRGVSMEEVRGSGCEFKKRLQGKQENL